ncbi:hypothetical protein DFH27DRAFT_605728 [Peziza echinospora]|nr:hypothetical protein DFH27DRAFT_605728 [Peziza echinospora]
MHENSYLRYSTGELGRSMLGRRQVSGVQLLSLRPASGDSLGSLSPFLSFLLTFFLLSIFPSSDLLHPTAIDISICKGGKNGENPPPAKDTPRDTLSLAPPPPVDHTENFVLLEKGRSSATVQAHEALRACLPLHLTERAEDLWSGERW